MKATFVGHQTWLVETSAGCIYFDPILTDTFGHSQSVQFPVFPPRRVDLGAMPRPAAVVISHEHHDHFHLPSLMKVRQLGGRQAFVGELVPAVVPHYLEKLGFEVTLLRSGELQSLGDVELLAFQCDHLTARWEERAYQWVIKEGDQVLLNTVDAHLSSAAAKHPTVQRTSTLIVANNSQVPPNPKYNNLLGAEVESREQRLQRRVQLFRALIEHPTKQIPSVRQVLICGSGYLEPMQDFGAFVDSDNDALSRVFSELRPDLTIRGAKPGSSWGVDDRLVTTAGYVELDQSSEHAYRAIGENASTAGTPLKPIKPLSRLDFADTTAADSRVVEELQELSGLLLMSGFGKILVHTGNVRPFVLCLSRASDEPLQFAFNVRSGEFVRDATAHSQLTSQFPYGIAMSLDDFLALLDARLQVWDVINVASRSWSESDQADSPNTFMFLAYGEHRRPDLTSRLLERRLAELQLCP